MGNVNKIVSLIIGLVTVAVFFAVLTGRINLKNKLPRISSNKSISPTPAKKIQAKNVPTPTLTYRVNQYQNQSNSQGQTGNISQIPTTGVSLFFYSTLFTTLSVGFYLRNKNK